MFEGTAKAPAPFLAPTGPVHEAPLARLDTGWARAWAKALNDPRDVVFVNLALAIAIFVWPAAIFIFTREADSIWLWAIPYWLGIALLFVDRFILMLHCTSHRTLFNRKFRALNLFIPWAIGPFMGETPESYFVHHMGMHHKEGNLPGDLSSTMPYDRDRFSNWLRYWGRFMFFGLPELFLYHRAKRSGKLVGRLAIGELGFWLACALLCFVNWQATLILFVLPVLVVRTLMMAGNWGQHAFVDPDEPNNDFKSSITCINTRYNRRCFNDGYHIIHHISPSLHYSEMADEFAKNIRLYGEQDAIVFDGYDFFEVWFLLMTGQKKKLARAFVQLPGAPVRTEEEIIALFDRRTRRFPAEKAAPPPNWFLPRFTDPSPLS